MKKTTLLILLAIFSLSGMVQAQNNKGPASGNYLDLKVYLDGAFNGSGLDTDLNPQDLPLS